MRDFPALKLDLTLALVHISIGSKKCLGHRCTLVMAFCSIMLCISLTSSFGTASSKGEGFQRSTGVLFPTTLP